MIPFKARCGLCESDSQMHKTIELRKSKRYPLKAPALFIWALQSGAPQSGRGITRDMNTFGVYVHTDALPPVGALVEMEIVLPKLADSGPGMHLHAEGVVLRCDYRGANECGFAASAQFYPETADVILSQLKVSAQLV
jgi:hypothetical protein